MERIDTMKRKQFEKGITQIAQEGAIQIFHERLHRAVEEVIVGVVGVLQFEVLESAENRVRRGCAPPGHAL